MTEPLLRIAYFAIGIYTFASALLTSTILSRAGSLTAVETLSLSSIWVSFVSFVLIITWASKAIAANPGHKLSESFLRVSFLTIGLFFGTCAVASTMALTASTSALQDWFCVGGLWFAFVSFCGILILPGRAGNKTAPVGAELSADAQSA